MEPITYWDLSGPERAALKEADVARFCDIELMTKGVLRPPELKLLPEEAVEMDLLTVYGIEVDGEYSKQKLDLAFEDASSAQDFLEQAPYRLVHDYHCGDYVRPITGASVVSMRVATEATRTAHKAELDRVAANKAANEKARRDYRDGVRKTDEALAQLWADYREQQQLAARVAEVRRTWETYKALANGDESVARQFLSKAFPLEFWKCRGCDVDLVAEAIGEPTTLPLPAQPS